jgi:hypothetical protein
VHTRLSLYLVDPRRTGPVLTLLSGAGNIHTPKEHSPAEGERGRGDQKHGHGGVLGSVFRSLSRAAGRDKSSDRKPDE